MAAAINFTGQLPRHTACFRTMPELTIGLNPSKSLSQLKQNNRKLDMYPSSLTRRAGKEQFNNRRLSVVMSSSDDVDFDFTLNSISASSMIMRFYTCINEKQLKELNGYISDDCYFEDCSFLNPIQGRKEVMQFFQQLTAGMGQNVKFCIEHVCEDDEFTAGVDWHLEWKQTVIPLTRGCSFFECSQKGNKLVIKRARVVIESPIKPGGIALILLKNVTSLFDDFPKAAEWFLTSAHIVLQLLVQLYIRLLAPIVKPLVAGYFKIWNWAARFFVFALSFLLSIAKKFFG